MLQRGGARAGALRLSKYDDFNWTGFGKSARLYGYRRGGKDRDHHSPRGARLVEGADEREVSAAELIHIERLKAGTCFTDAVARVREVVNHPELAAPGRKKLVVDATGLGSPVMEMIRGARLNCELRPVVITGGSGERNSGGQWHVAKSDLMTGLRTSMEKQDLLIAERLPETPALVKELTAFGGSGPDDMVMALALALWGARRHSGGRTVR